MVEIIETDCCCGVNINGVNVSSEWEQIASLPIELYAHSAITVDGKIYILGGKNVNESAVKDLFEFDPLNDKYTQKKSMIVAKSHLSSIAECQGYIYVAGGQLSNNEMINTAHRYHIATDTWEQIANLPTKRIGMTLIHLNGLIYAIGGWDANNAGTVEVYNPLTNVWSKKKDMPTARRYPSSFVLDGKIYVVGGYSEIEKTYKNNVEIYDPNKDIWTSASPMNIERSAFGITEHNGFFYAFGGLSKNGVYTDSIEKYNPNTDKWTLLNCKMPDKILAFAISLYSSSTYIFGGSKKTPIPEKSVYKYTPIELDSPVIQLDNDNILNWESVEGSSGYNVYRKVNDGPCTLVAENISVTTYIDKNQEAGNTYHYVVRSVNESGVSCHSNEVSVEIPNPPVYKRALLVIRMVNHDWFEYDLTVDGINDFVHWYDNAPSEDLKPYYVFDKDFNIGPFQSRKDHIVHNKIAYFEIKEY